MFRYLIGHETNTHDLVVIEEKLPGFGERVDGSYLLSCGVRDLHGLEVPSAIKQVTHWVELHAYEFLDFIFGLY